jgi:IS30 family transposase
MQNAGIELGQKGSVTLATGGRKLEVTQRELADFIGVPEETVCRELSRLRIQQQQ